MASMDFTISSNCTGGDGGGDVYDRPVEVEVGEHEDEPPVVEAALGGNMVLL